MPRKCTDEDKITKWEKEREVIGKGSNRQGLSVRTTRRIGQDNLSKDVRR